MEYTWITCEDCGTEYNSLVESCPGCRDARLFCGWCEKHFTYDESVIIREDYTLYAPFGQLRSHKVDIVDEETCPDCGHILEEE